VKKNKRSKNKKQIFLQPKILLVIFLFLCYLLIKQINTSHKQDYTGSVIFRLNSERTGNLTQKNFHTEIKPEWQKIRTGGKVNSSPLVVNETVYIGSNDGNLYAINLRTGKQLWSFNSQDSIVSSPFFSNNTVYFGSHNGNIYALRASNGTIKWIFSTEGLDFIDSSPIVFDNIVYFGSFDGKVYALDAQNGNKIWEYKTNGIVSSSPAVEANKVYIGSYDGYVYALDSKKGDLVWKFKTNGEVLSSPIIYNDKLFIGSYDNKFYALNKNNGKKLWEFETKGIISSSPAIKENTIYFGSFDKKLYALDLQTGKEKWNFLTNGAIGSSPAINKDTVYFGGFDGGLYALDIVKGEKKWIKKTKGPINSSPAVADNYIIFGSSDGNIYCLNKDSQDEKFITFNSENIDKFGLFELMIEWSEEGLVNPWEDAELTAVFSDSKNNTFEIFGFYYGTNIWKLRFSPPVIGSWTWDLTFKSKYFEIKDFGSFFVNQSEEPGFLKINPENKYRFVYNNGSFFNGIGLNEAVSDWDQNGDPLDNWGMDGRMVKMEDYLKAYGKNGAGFNLFRWSVDNASFKLWKIISVDNNSYLVKEGFWGDKLISGLKENGFRIWLTLFGFEPPFQETANLNRAEKEAIKRYVKYIVARYGAYVDIWELMNEASVSDEWIKEISSYLRSIDPYKRLITTNWEKPDLPSIDINSIHLYEKESEFDSDILIAKKVAQAKKWGKPVVFSEQGNKITNWDEKSALRMRIRSWTAFFSEAILIFWNSSYKKGFVSNSFEATNIYLGEEERKYINILQNFTSDADVKLKPFEIDLNNVEIRSYGLRSDKQILGYFHHFTNHKNPVNSKINLDFPKSGQGEWVNPADGKIIGRFRVSQGRQILTVPAFIIDLALKIELDN
jgi:outer membrane protein assembly factor BamB